MDMANVLIIDDDIEYLSLLKEALEDKFKVNFASNLSTADGLVKEHDLFDIVLVDEYIGDDKGSDWIASQKKAGKAGKSFVLYSGLATEEAILNGLTCGADDFLSKPISLITLANKLEKLIEYQSKIHDFESEIKSKDNVINISMAQASKYGSCMQLTSRINQCFNFEQIRDEVFSFFYKMELKACIAFYPVEEKPSFYSSVNGYCSPVEIDVMKLLHEKPRLFRFGSRVIFNHALISILVLNLEESHADTDIYIDALASVIECLGARMEFLLYKSSLISVQEQISQAVHTTKKMVEISKHHQQEVMNDIVQKIGMSFHVLDLNEEQEVYLADLVHSTLKKHSQDDMNFLEVLSLLDQGLESVDKLKELNQQEAPTEDIMDDEDVLF